MTASVLRFPLRRAAAIFVCAERDGGGWLAIAGAHGWLCRSMKPEQWHAGSHTISGSQYGRRHERARERRCDPRTE
jgi:hypothetical protein